MIALSLRPACRRAGRTKEPQNLICVQGVHKVFHYLSVKWWKRQKTWKWKELQKLDKAWRRWESFEAHFIQNHRMISGSPWNTATTERNAPFKLINSSVYLSHNWLSPFILPPGKMVCLGIAFQNLPWHFWCLTRGLKMFWMKTGKLSQSLPTS